MRILHIDTGRVLRGGQEQLLLLGRGLRQRGHEQTVACPLGSALEAAARADGFPVLALPPRDRLYVRSAMAVRLFLRRHACQIVHAHDGHAQTVAWLGSAGLAVKRVASRLVVFEPRHPLVHRLKYTHTCHRVVALSGPVRQVLLKHGVPDARIELIRGGIEFPTSIGGVDAGLQWRAEQGFTGQHFVVGHVAAFTAEKGQATALEALALLRARLPGAVMVLVGEGPLRLAPEMQARLRKTGGAARLPGYVQDLTGFYAGCDVFLMPSLSEALGVAALHAMAHALPVIASRVGGLPEVVTEGETGWLVPPGDPEALAAAIVEAESDTARLRRFGERARERAREFSCGATAGHTESMYRRLCGEE